MGLVSFVKEYSKLLQIQGQMAKVFPSYKMQREWLDKLREIDSNIKGAHNPSHVLQFMLAVFQLPKDANGCIVEAGVYKGASTAKISLAANQVNRPLYAFDSFQGLPANKENHLKSTTGYSIQGWFEEGKFAGSFDEVYNNVEKYGDINSVSFVQGWFENTMPSFKESVALAYLDVDLASSTRVCLKYLYPLLTPGGAIYSQDGDFPLVIDVFKDERFWIDEVGCTSMPVIKDLGKKITIIQKQ